MSLICFISTISAQFYDSQNIYLYAAVGEEVSPYLRTSILYVHFDENGRLYHSNFHSSGPDGSQFDIYKVQQLYEKQLLIDYARNKEHFSEYTPNFSTNKYVVYWNWDPNYMVVVNGELIPKTRKFLAFSNDREELITWMHDRYSNDIKFKVYYKRVKIEDIVIEQEPINYDFLY